MNPVDMRRDDKGEKKNEQNGLYPDVASFF